MPLSDPDYRLLKSVGPILINVYQIVHDVLPTLSFAVDMTGMDFDRIKHTIDSDGNAYAVHELIQTYKSRATDLNPFIRSLKDAGYEHIALKLSRGQELTIADTPTVDLDQDIENVLKVLRDNYQKYYCLQNQQEIDVGNQWVNLRIKLPSGRCRTIGDNPNQQSEAYWNALFESFPHNIMFYIVGQKGYGKSTLAKRLAFEWAQKRLPNLPLLLCARPTQHFPPFDTALDMALFRLERLNYLKPAQINFVRNYALREAPNATYCLVVIDDFESATNLCGDITVQMQLEEGRNFDYKLALLTDTKPITQNSTTRSAEILPWTDDHVRRFVELFFPGQPDTVQSVMRCYRSRRRDTPAIPVDAFIMCNRKVNGEPNSR